MNRFIYIIFVSFFFTCLSVSGRYKVSSAGERMIKEYETCQLTSYWDSNGYSIGYGHHTKNVYKGMKITKAKAEYFFRKDINEVNESIKRLIDGLPVKHSFSQNFIDGLGDCIYNCGEYAVRNSDFYARLMKCRKDNKKDIHYSVAAIKTLKIRYKGNVRRRHEVHKIMLS